MRQKFVRLFNIDLVRNNLTEKKIEKNKIKNMFKI